MLNGLGSKAKQAQINKINNRLHDLRTHIVVMIIFFSVSNGASANPIEVLVLLNNVPV